MRRLLAFFVLCACSAARSLPLPKPTPTPTPTTVRQPGPTLAGKRAGRADLPLRDPLGPRRQVRHAPIAQIYAQVLTQTGGVKVLAIPPSIKREDYQTYAHVHTRRLLHQRLHPADRPERIDRFASRRRKQRYQRLLGDDAESPTFKISARRRSTRATVILEAAGIDRPQLQSGSHRRIPRRRSDHGRRIGPDHLDRHRSLPWEIARQRPVATPTPIAAQARARRDRRAADRFGNDRRCCTPQATSSSARWTSTTRRRCTRWSTTQNLRNQADSICGANRDNTIASGLLDVHARRRIPRARLPTRSRSKVYACFGAVLYTGHRDERRLHARDPRRGRAHTTTQHPKNNA